MIWKAIHICCCVWSMSCFGTFIIVSLATTTWLQSTPDATTLGFEGSRNGQTACTPPFEKSTHRHVCYGFFNIVICPPELSRHPAEIKLVPSDFSWRVFVRSIVRDRVRDTNLRTCLTVVFIPWRLLKVKGSFSCFFSSVVTRGMELIIRSLHVFRAYANI
jgi:hypothetical protein